MCLDLNWISMDIYPDPTQIPVCPFKMVDFQQASEEIKALFFLSGGEMS